MRGSIWNVMPPIMMGLLFIVFSRKFGYGTAEYHRRRGLRSPGGVWQVLFCAFGLLCIFMSVLTILGIVHLR
jgi:hypothetical protein